MGDFSSFLLNRQHSSFILIACVAAVVACFLLRRSPWMLLVWLPSFALTVSYTCALAFQFLKGFTGQGPEAGWYVLAGMMEALLGFPIVIAAVLLLVFHPVKSAWQPRYLVSAIVLTAIAPIALMSWFTLSKPQLGFAVTDEAGKPLGGVAVRDVFNSPARFTTDRTGVFHDRVPHRDIFACCFTAEGYQEHHVTVYRGGANAETYYVDHSWIDRSANHITVTESQRIEYPAKDSTIIPVVMKRMMPNKGSAANRRPAGQSDGSGDLSAIVAADPAVPATVAELTSEVIRQAVF